MLMMDVRDVARELKVSPRQVWKLVASGQFPKPVRIARSVRWRRDEVTAWIAAGCPTLTQWETMRGNAVSA